MNQDNIVLLRELCYLAVTRNKINTRRHRARYRKNYYAHAVRVVEAHQFSNYEHRRVMKMLSVASIPHDQNEEANKLKMRLRRIEKAFHALINSHPKPKKWQTMGLHKLRSLVLQGEAEYAMAKHETMEFSIKHRSRVKQITSTLECSIVYNNGSIEDIFIRQRDAVRLHLDLKQINEYAIEHELNSSVENMLKES